LYNAYRLKFANDEDTSLWVTSDGATIFTNQASDFSKDLDSSFKFIPNNSYTAELSELVDSKDGVGLMIYDTTYSPNISPNYLGQTLRFDGPGGLYETFWKKFLKFRLNASHVEMTGYFTAIELEKISKLMRIYIDHQEYVVANLQYSETAQTNYEVVMKLESVGF